jgi:hypothetical protein
MSASTSTSTLPSLVSSLISLLPALLAPEIKSSLNPSSSDLQTLLSPSFVLPSVFALIWSLFLHFLSFFNPLRLPSHFRHFRHLITHGKPSSATSPNFAELKARELRARVGLGVVELVGWVVVLGWGTQRDLARSREVLDKRGVVTPVLVLERPIDLAASRLRTGTGAGALGESRSGDGRISSHHEARELPAQPTARRHRRDSVEELELERGGSPPTPSATRASTQVGPGPGPASSSVPSAHPDHLSPHYPINSALRRRSSSAISSSSGGTTRPSRPIRSLRPPRSASLEPDSASDRRPSRLPVSGQWNKPEEVSTRRFSGNSARGENDGSLVNSPLPSPISPTELESLPEESGGSRWDRANDSDSDDPLRYPRNFLDPDEEDEGSGDEQLGEGRRGLDSRARRNTLTKTRRNTLSAKEGGGDRDEDDDVDGDGDGDGDGPPENDEEDVLDRAEHLGKAALEATSPRRAGVRSKTKGMLLSEDMRGWWVYGSIVGMAIAGVVLGRMPL